MLSLYKPMAERKYGLTRIGIFGSVARNEQTEDSDVDVCYEGKVPSLLTLDLIQSDLEKMGFESDSVKSVSVINILWNTISFTTRCNFEPQVLSRDDGRNIPSNRIMALKGNYNELMQGVKNHDEEITRLLENEIASLYIPPDETQKCIFKIKYSGQEFTLNQTDAPREVVLKVVEIVCGSNVYHKDGSVRTFTV